MKITYFYNEDWEMAYVKERLPEQELVFIKGATTDNPNSGDDTTEVLSVFVNSRVGKAVFDRFPKLKHVALRSTGYDNVDLKEAKKRGISISYVPAYGQNTVAEFAMALLLALSRKIIECSKYVRTDGLFTQNEKMRGFDLAGKTIGVVGVGRIGQHMVRMAKGFGMKVVAFDLFPKEDLAQELGFSYLSLDELLASSDVVSLHLPYTEETHHILNANNISKMKRGSIFINTARGGLVDTKALARAVRDGTLAGCGLDVLEDEMYVQDEGKLIFSEDPSVADMEITLENHYLIDHPNTIVSPHNAFNTDEAIRRILDTATSNMDAFIGGRVANIIPNA